MAKFIGVKMIEAVLMTAREANDKGLGFVLQWAKYGLKK